VENCKLQSGLLKAKTEQTHALDLNQVQARNIEKEKAIANHHVWQKAWLVARVCPWSGSRRNQENSSMKIRIETGSKSKEHRNPCESAGMKFEGLEQGQCMISEAQSCAGIWR